MLIRGAAQLEQGRAVCLLACCVALCLFPASAFAATFAQSGSTVVASTVNSSSSWHVDVYYSDTTETPIPKNSEHFYNDWQVPAGTVTHSFQMPSLHRRYRFEVSSSFVASGTYEPGAVVYSPWWSEGSTGSFSIGTALGSVVTSGQPLQVDGGMLSWSAHGAGTVVEVPSQWSFYDPDLESDAWALEGRYGVRLQGTTSAPVVVDDSGSGEFENPSWLGFQPPIALASSDQTDGVAPFRVQFTGSTSYDLLGRALSYFWSFGDGSVATTANPTHSFDSSGTYSVMLTVTDPEGQTASASFPVRVLAAVVDTPTVEETVSVTASGTVGISTLSGAAGAFAGLVAFFGGFGLAHQGMRRFSGV